MLRSPLQSVLFGLCILFCSHQASATDFRGLGLNSVGGYKPVVERFESASNELNVGWHQHLFGGDWVTESDGEITQMNPWYRNEDGHFTRLVHESYRCHERIKIAATVRADHTVIHGQTMMGPGGYTMHSHDIGSGLIAAHESPAKFLACYIDTRRNQRVRLAYVNERISTNRMRQLRQLRTSDFFALQNQHYQMTLEIQPAPSGWVHILCSALGSFKRRWARATHRRLQLHAWVYPAWNPYVPVIGSVGLMTNYAAGSFREILVDTTGVISTQCCRGPFYELRDGRCQSRGQTVCDQWSQHAGVQYLFDETKEYCVRFDELCSADCMKLDECRAAGEIVRVGSSSCQPGTEADLDPDYDCCAWAPPGDCVLDRTYFAGANRLTGPLRQMRFSEEECYWIAKQLGGMGYSFQKMRYRPTGFCKVVHMASPKYYRPHRESKSLVFRSNVSRRFRNGMWWWWPQCDIVNELSVNPFETCDCLCNDLKNCQDQGGFMTDRSDATCTFPEANDPPLFNDPGCLCCDPDLWNVESLDALQEQCTADRGLWIDDRVVNGALGYVTTHLLGQHDNLALATLTVSKFVEGHKKDTLNGVSRGGTCAPCMENDCIATKEACTSAGLSWYPERCYPYTIGAQGFGVADSSECEALGKEWVRGQCYSPSGDIDCNKELCDEDSLPVSCNGDNQVWRPGKCTGPHASILTQSGGCNGLVFSDFTQWRRDCLDAARMWTYGPAWTAGFCEQTTSARRRMLGAAEGFSLAHSDWLQQYVEPGYEEHVHVHDWIEDGLLDKPLEGRDSSVGHGGIHKSKLDGELTKMIEKRERHLNEFGSKKPMTFGQSVWQIAHEESLQASVQVEAHSGEVPDEHFKVIF